MEGLQQETATAIANLANATLADRSTMTAMQATITTLTSQLAEANQKLMDSLNANTTLKEVIAAGGGNSNASGNSSRNSGNNGSGYTAAQYIHYCWTHGPKSSHPSSGCSRPAEGHNAAATHADKMGGRTTKWKRFGAGA